MDQKSNRMYLSPQNCDIGNFTGFEVLVKRVKDGRAVCKEYTEFLRQVNFLSMPGKRVYL